MKSKVNVLVLAMFAVSLMFSAQASLSADGAPRLSTLDVQDWTEDWQGVWEFTNVYKDCVTGIVDDEETFQDVICPGDPFDPEQDPEGPGFECSVVQINANTIHAECSGSVLLFPGCGLSINTVVDATRNGNTISGTQTLNFDYQGECGVEDSCDLIEFTGTRIDPNPSCETPAAQASWGTLKSIYR